MIVPSIVASRVNSYHHPTQRLVLPLSTSLKLFPTHGRQFVLHPHRTRATTGTDVVAAVEGQDSPPVSETDANDNSDAAATTTTRSNGNSKTWKEEKCLQLRTRSLLFVHLNDQTHK
ncbi:elongation factor Ts family protein [Raphanus sativus]|nr:elongation factor Ts family protein [Raphanus sativus]